MSVPTSTLKKSAPAAGLRRAPLERARGISRVLSPYGGGSFIWDRCYQRPHAAYPGLRWGGPPLVLYLALLRVGFTVRLLLPEARCALTAPFHPYLCRERPSAVYSLWHFPSPCDARTLSGTLPFGARTFLQRSKPPAILTRTLIGMVEEAPAPRHGAPSGRPASFGWPYPSGWRH